MKVCADTDEPGTEEETIGVEEDYSAIGGDRSMDVGDGTGMLLMAIDWVFG